MLKEKTLHYLANKISRIAYFLVPTYIWVLGTMFLLGNCDKKIKFKIQKSIFVLKQYRIFIILLFTYFPLFKYYIN